MLTQARAKELFDYDPETGILSRIKKTSNARLGPTSQRQMPSGHLVIRVDGKLYLTHRVIWLWMIGDLPEFIDHKDMSGANNRWENLRECTKSQNAMNANKRRTSSSKWKGVWYRQKAGNWEARIGIGGAGRYLGVFDCPAAASFAYQIAADKLHGEFARSA